MKKLFLLFVAAMFAAVSLSACSDDDEGNDNPPTQSGDSDSYASLIVGTWEVIHTYSENIDGEGSGYDVEPGMMAWHVLTFKADKTYSGGDAYANQFNGIYSIEGNKLISRSQEEIDVFVKTIKTLTATTLELEEDDYTHGVTTYKRI